MEEEIKKADGLMRKWESSLAASVIKVALTPLDPFVLGNLKTAKEMEKEYSRYSVGERQKMKEEKH